MEVTNVPSLPQEPVQVSEDCWNNFTQANAPTNTSTTVTTGYMQVVSKSPCKTCGRCPDCGQLQPVYPYYYQPYYPPYIVPTYPTYPNYPTWGTVTGNVTFKDGMQCDQNT